jgi:hypothetical protein
LKVQPLGQTGFVIQPDNGATLPHHIAFLDFFFSVAQDSNSGLCRVIIEVSSVVVTHSSVFAPPSQRLKVISEVNSLKFGGNLASFVSPKP